MLIDNYGRPIYYLRVSITDKCNLRCRYCMPVSGIENKLHNNLLRIEEMERIVRLFVAEGITSVRITGGEPLVHKGIIPFVDSISKINLKDLSMTTNGVLLPKFAKDLKQAGLNRINISLDSLRPDRFSWITRGGDVNTVLQGIESALDNGLEPVKINMVVSKGLNSDEVWEVANLAKAKPLHVRFIELMPIGNDQVLNQENFVSSAESKAILESIGGSMLRQSVRGCGPAEVYTFPNWQGTVGFIHAVSSHFCNQCNRLRLTSEGKIYPCLHSQICLDLLPAIRKGIDDQGLVEMLRQAVKLKPERSTLGAQQHCMHSIGG